MVNKKELVVYISMGFGNPYGDPWSIEVVQHWVSILAGMGIKIIALSDTVGVSNRENISVLFSTLIPGYPAVEFGAHLHSRPENVEEKMHAAYTNGCRRFDAAIMGFGGCPMADDALVGNMPTEKLIEYLEKQKVATGIDKDFFNKAMSMASGIFV